MRVLLIEDDLSLNQALTASLRNQGYAITSVNNGKDGIAAIASKEFSLVILDLGLPDIDGLSILQHCHAQENLNTLILSARGSTDERIIGLDAGADDYLAKPFEMDELFARIRVIERRHGTATSSVTSIGEVKLDSNTHQLHALDQTLLLARKEFMLLKVLMENAGRIQQKRQLEETLYSWGEELSSNAIEVHIHNLRKKLPKDYIRTIRGVGYMVNRDK